MTLGASFKTRLDDVSPYKLQHPPPRTRMGSYSNISRVALVSCVNHPLREWQHPAQDSAMANADRARKETSVGSRNCGWKKERDGEVEGNGKGKRRARTRSRPFFLRGVIRFGNGKAGLPFLHHPSICVGIFHSKRKAPSTSFSRSHVTTPTYRQVHSL